MFHSLSRYFSEFKVLKDVSRDFWLTNSIQFFDGLAQFSMMAVLSLYLTTNCGFSDMDSAAWFGIFSLYITTFVFAVGSICDSIGIKRSFVIGCSLLAIARLGLGILPTLTTETIPAGSPIAWLYCLLPSAGHLHWYIKGLLLLMALGTSFMSPIVMTSIRRFTSKENRATGFNVYYLLMNVSSILANVLVLDGFRKGLGEVKGNLAIFDFGFLMAIIAFLLSRMIHENNYAEPSECLQTKETRRPLAIFLEVWKESAFQKLILFLILTIGVRLVFTNQYLVLPKYITRTLYSDFSLGLVNCINPLIIVIGLILLIPIINRYSTIKLIIIGMAVSASSLIIMAIPTEWVMQIPGIRSVTDAYLCKIITQIVVFAVGELIFNPRFTEYIASVSPPDKVSSYLALATLPTFISKPLNGFVSGILISRYCYEGIRPKLETGNISYGESPELMWLVYLALAIISPLAVIAMKNFLTQKTPSSTQKETQP